MAEGLFLAFLLVLLVWIPCGFFAAVVAEGKGHNGIAWFFGGFLFGPMGLLAVVGLEDRKLRRYIRLLGEHQGMERETFLGKPLFELPDPQPVRERKPRDPNKPKTIGDRLDDIFDPDTTFPSE